LRRRHNISKFKSSSSRSSSCLCSCQVQVHGRYERHPHGRKALIQDQVMSLSSSCQFTIKSSSQVQADMKGTILKFKSQNFCFVMVDQQSRLTPSRALMALSLASMALIRLDGASVVGDRKTLTLISSRRTVAHVSSSRPAANPHNTYTWFKSMEHQAVISQTRHRPLPGLHQVCWSVPRPCARSAQLPTILSRCSLPASLQRLANSLLFCADLSLLSTLYPLSI